MPGYGAADQTITVAANQTVNMIMNLTYRASVYGKITLPAPITNSTWINVQGTPNGSNYPTIFGGASFNVGQSTGIYSIYGVTAGTYTFHPPPAPFPPPPQNTSLST